MKIFRANYKERLGKTKSFKLQKIKVESLKMYQNSTVCNSLQVFCVKGSFILYSRFFYDFFHNTSWQHCILVINSIVINLCYRQLSFIYTYSVDFREKKKKIIMKKITIWQKCSKKFLSLLRFQGRSPTHLRYGLHWQ